LESIVMKNLFYFIFSTFGYFSRFSRDDAP